MDLYPQIFTQFHRFFESDVLNLPLELEGKFCRIEVPVPSLEPLGWLARQEVDLKTYWCDRVTNFTMAGVGALDLITSNLPIDYFDVFGQLKKPLSALFPQIRYYGGIGFSQDLEIDSSWQLFGNYRFVVPRFELCTDGIDTIFACNFRHISDGSSRKSDHQVNLYQQELETVLTELAQLDLNLDLTMEGQNSRRSPSDLALFKLRLPKLHNRVDQPDQAGWHQNIDQALAKFTDLGLDKVVLARQSTLTFNANLKPQLLLQSLKPDNLQSYHFCLQINPNTAFVGTSPERLYARQDRQLQTEAIAGTRQRGDSIQLDLDLSDLLRKSPKDLHEHQLVVDRLRTVLTELCDSITVGQAATILKLNKVQHLYTQCQGILKPHLNDADILPLLHPTPAVGGFPRTQALNLIRETEPFDRGWYAAPVGWVGHDETEFAVAIRSGLINGDQLRLFAGAGIVRGSQPAEEWAEIENKIRHFTELFTESSVDSTLTTSWGVNI
jgi:menaquinone-specific isochorismate synthase